MKKILNIICAFSNSFLPGMIFFLLWPGKVCAQPIQFQHINSSKGLSGNNVTGIAIDKSGLLWIGTTDGINVYDGYKVSAYNAFSNPQLSVNKISAILCDSHDRIWYADWKGLSYLDSNRSIKRVIANSESATGEKYYISTIVETSQRDILAMSNNGIFSINADVSSSDPRSFTPVKWADSILGLSILRTRDISRIRNDEYAFIVEDSLNIIDFAKKKRTFFTTIPDLCSACLISDDEILVATFQGKLFIINIVSNEIKQYQQVGKNKNDIAITNITRIRRISPGIIGITSFFSGLNILDLGKGYYTQYLHDPINEHSLSENRATDIFCTDGVNIFIATYNTGLNFFNPHNNIATHIDAFTDHSNHIFDGYVNGIQIDDNKKVWLAAFDRIIVWDRENDSLHFLPYYKNIYNTGLKPLEIKALCKDKYGKIWASFFEEGVARIDEKTYEIQLVTVHDTSGKMSALKSSYIQDIVADKEGNVWGCSGFGVFAINARTLTVDTFIHHPVLKELLNTRINKIYIDTADRVWLASQFSGVFCYDKAKQTLKNYSATDGLPSNRCFNIAQDKKGNYYFGTSNGVAVLNHNGNIKVYNDTNGLRSNVCLGLLADAEGKIWIANNHNTLVCFNPADSSFKYFAEESGMGFWGFRLNSFFKTGDNELFWGCNKGLTFFHTSQLNSIYRPLILSIQKIFLADSLLNFTKSASLTLPYNQNKIEFYFTAVDVYGSQNIQYQYMLEGFDAHWINGTDLTTAKYSFLTPGNYKFKVRASRDGMSWKESINEISITIQAPFWRTWYFMGFCILSLVMLLYAFIRWREQNIKAIETEKTKVQELTAQEYKNQLELEQVSNFFSTSFINKNNIDELLKEVAKNLISKLGFEDCMIYLWNEDKTKLIQKAGYGPLGSLEDVEKSAFEVLPGQGVVGYVAMNREAVIIPDTSDDLRYRADEMVRLSEICVPIRYNDELLGVIDSEHKDKNFFTPRHLRIMATIATMIAGKIKSIESEKALRQRKNELEIVQRHLAQVQLAGLRSQMNPHFIFNSLNSINTFILKNDQENASDYLNKFSQLMRIILDNSRSEWILLESDIKALQLYIELEAMRFENVFSYNINISPEVSLMTTLVPPMLIQPYVENAIWHGLMHRKEPRGMLNINVLKKGQVLIIEVEDNGIGMDASARLKSKSNRLHKSHGMDITAERLAIVNELYKINAKVSISDICDINPSKTGTKVILTIEYRNYESNHS